MRRIVAFWSGLFVLGAVLVQISPVAAEPVGGDFTGDSVILVVDVSGSMSGTPLSQAKEALHSTVASLDDGVAVGLRSYAGSCGNGGSNLVAVGLDNRAELDAAIDGLSAGGGTPTPDALRAAVGDLPPQGQRSIVLVSDGASTCGDVCPVASELVASAAVDFTVFTVGFNAPENAAADLTCVADTTGGTYVEATDTETLIDAIGGAVGGAPIQNLVVLGDSYSSGEGTFYYYMDTISEDGWGGCHRSPSSWAEVLSDTSNELDLVGFYACSGAVIDNVLPDEDEGEWKNGEAPQLDQLQDLVDSGVRVDLVMLTIGGNDMKFAKILTECRVEDCGDKLKNYNLHADRVARRIGREVIPAIRRVAGPSTEVILVGYPRLVPTDPDDAHNCNWLEPHEQIAVYGASAALNVRQLWATQDSVYDVGFINSMDVFDGDELCSGSGAYMNPVTPGPIGSHWKKSPEQAHPTELGYAHWAVYLKQQLIAQGVIGS